MNLHSLYKSSMLEILMSKRTITALYAVAGAAIYTHMFMATYQFYEAYSTLGSFDVPRTDFYLALVLFFVPFWLTGSLILRAVFRRVRLAFWFKNSFSIVEYSSRILPAEAGFLVDYEFNHKEVYAMLVNLCVKGILEIVQDGEDVYIKSTGASTDELREYERLYLEKLFGGSEYVATSTILQGSNLVAAQEMHEQIVLYMEDGGYIDKDIVLKPWHRVMFRTVYVIAGLVGLLYIYGTIVAWDELNSILYPRYDADVLQVVLTLAVVLTNIAVALSGLFISFNKKSVHDLHHEGWMAVSGYKQYLTTVFKTRFNRTMLHTQDFSSIQDHYAYAVVLGVVEFNEHDFIGVGKYSKPRRNRS